jgi:predicted LPLAT superfamily acyltransferase
VTTKLLTAPRFNDHDAAFRAIVEAHRGLTAEESAALNARLVLLLANHIGDMDVLCEALAVAKPRAKL